MDIKILENISINWELSQAEKSLGTSGFVFSKSVDLGTIRMRQLSFSENYEADHWCEKGHIIHVLAGELIIEYQDGSQVTIPTGQSLILGDSISLHKAKTESESTVLIID